MMEYSKEALIYIMPSVQHRCINAECNLRFKMAEVQKDKPHVDKEKIVEYVNDYLRLLNMKPITYEEALKTLCADRKTRIISYSTIFRKNKNDGMECKEDIVWIKFSDLNGKDVISVIGTGCDISFSEETKRNTAAGKINTHLGLEWDKENVLIFPLKNLTKLGLNRSDVESGIGNYLISKNVPILDYYSHNY